MDRKHSVHLMHMDCHHSNLVFPLNGLWSSQMKIMKSSFHGMWYPSHPRKWWHGYSKGCPKGAARVTSRGKAGIMSLGGRGNILFQGPFLKAVTEFVFKSILLAQTSIIQYNFKLFVKSWMLSSTAFFFYSFECFM